MDFIKELFDELEVEISYEFKNGSTTFNTNGPEIGVCGAVGHIVTTLLKNGVSRELLKDAIELGFEKGSKHEN